MGLFGGSGGTGINFGGGGKAFGGLGSQLNKGLGGIGTGAQGIFSGGGMSLPGVVGLPGGSGSGSGSGGGFGFNQQPLPPAPERPAYRHAFENIDKGRLKSAFTMQDPQDIAAQGVNFNAPDMSNMEAVSAMRDRALSTEDSPWLKMQLEQNEMDKMGMLDSMNMEQAGAQADARGQLAMRGGMSTGARERLASSGARDSMRASQGIYGLKQATDLQSRLADQNTKTDLLKSTAGLEADMGKFTSSGQLDASKINAANQLAADQFNTQAGMNTDQYNIGNRLKGLEGINQADYNYYAEDQKVRAAEAMARAMGQSGGGQSSGLGGILSGLPIVGGLLG